MENNWMENNGDTALDRSDRPRGDANTAPARGCAKCGSAIQSGQRFCSVCGEAVYVTTSSEAAAAINQFNEGIRQQKKKKNRTPAVLGILGAVLAIAVLMILQSGPKVEYVSLDPSFVELCVDDTVTVDCDTYPEEASDVEVTWTTSNSSVATVKNGKITAKGEGSCVITAEAGGKTDTVRVDVVDLTPEERAAVGVYDSTYWVDEDGDIDDLSTSFATLILRNDLTGNLSTGDGEVDYDFVWSFHESDDGDNFFIIQDGDDEVNAFGHMDDGTIMLGVGDSILILE